MTPRATPRAGITTLALAAAIVVLTLATAYIHSTLGGLLFTLNAIGYAGLAFLLVVSMAVPLPIVRRFRWFPPVALAGYALVTIGGYLVIGPYFTLGWITKGIEVGLITLLVVLVRRQHGSLDALVGDARTSLSWLVEAVRRRAPAELPLSVERPRIEP